MKLTTIKYLLLFLIGLTYPSLGQNSLLATGEWYKIPIHENAVYKINSQFLKAYGINVNNINPNHIQFFISPQKFLPQANSVTREVSFKEIPIFTNDTNGSFEENDYLLFYAEDQHRVYFDSLSGHLKHFQHPYAESNYVFMRIGDSKSKKIDVNLETIQNPKTVNSLTHFEWYEPQFVNLLNTGREWYGEYLVSEWSKKFEIIGRKLDQAIHLNSNFVSQTYEDTELKFLSDMTEIGSISLRKINYRWNDSYKRYNRAGEISEKSFLFHNPNESFEFTFQLPTDINISSGVYLDFFEISAERDIKFYTKQHQAYALEKEAIKFQLDINTEHQFIWDVSSMLMPKILKPNSEQIFSFQHHQEYGKLAFFDLNNLIIPKRLEALPNQNLSLLPSPQLLIVYPEYFEKEVQTLAKFRQENDQLEVSTVTLKSIYNEFSGGKVDPTAIRDFCRSLWSKNNSQFKYLLLFGDTNFDIQNHNHLDYVKKERLVPTYESKESLEPIYSYSSDDYFGFLEDHEGQWPEGFSKNGRWYSTQNRDHSLDISVGRLPVKDRIEAKLLVDKIIHYSSSKDVFGKWKRNISFVADDADLNIHQRDAERFSSISEENNAAIQTKKIYLDSYPQIETEKGIRAPEANEAFEKAIIDGSLIINYNGHGSENGWTDEKLLTINQIVHWRNMDRMPILFTATCEFGRYDNPSIVSGAELALLNPNGGAIALLTTTRPVFSSTNFKINQAFYNTIFENSTSPIRLGDVFRITKNNSIDGEVNRNFSLLGDPSIQISYPNLSISIDKINDRSPEDYLMKGLEKIILSGHVHDENFNGKINISLYDKSIPKTTIGSPEYPKMTYNSLENKIYEGIAEVRDGQFKTTFIIPEDINSEIGKGQLYFYAVDTDSTRDAIGGFNQFLIGEKLISEQMDTQPPEIDFHFDADNQTIHITTSDESGINISKLQDIKNLILVLNDTLHIPLHDYFVANAEGKEGSIDYTFHNLPIGNHHIDLIIADVYNNLREASFSFTIALDPFELKLNNLYPNPASDIVTLKLSHNRVGADLHFDMSFYDLSGKLMGQEQRDCYSCEKEIKFGMNVELFFPEQGKYLYQIKARLISNNEQDSKSGHLLFWK